MGTGFHKHSYGLGAKKIKLASSPNTNKYYVCSLYGKGLDEACGSMCDKSSSLSIYKYTTSKLTLCLPPPIPPDIMC